MTLMSTQAPAGWYPDREGRDRYWDGCRWTDEVRDSAAAGINSDDLRASKESAFSRLRKVAADKQADKRAAKEELERKQAEDAQRAGGLVTSGVFGVSTIEVYENGYVRVATFPGNSPVPASVTQNTPYEKLISIKFTRSGPEQGTGVASAVEGAAGPALMSLMKGGRTVMKVSPAAAAFAGAAHLAKNASQKSFLTIATATEIHTLTNQSHNGFIKTSNRGHDEVGLVLEAAGNSVLGIGVGDRQPAAEPPSVAGSPSAPTDRSTGPSLTDQLRELAELRKGGILTDEEFADAKATLLRRS